MAARTKTASRIHQQQERVLATFYFSKQSARLCEAKPLSMRIALRAVTASTDYHRTIPHGPEFGHGCASQLMPLTPGQRKQPAGHTR